MRRLFARLANPVAIRELRGTFRSSRAFVSLSLFVLLQALIFLGAMLKASGDPQSYYTYGPYRASQDWWQMGHRIFLGFAWMLGLLVYFFVPAISANLIVLEREKRTLEFLELTRLSPFEIALGKYVGALAYTLVLLVTSLPLMSLTFILGGVSPFDVLLFAGIWALSVLVLAAVGISCSAIFSRAITATTATYLITAPFAVLMLQVTDIKHSSITLAATVPFFDREVPGFALAAVLTLAGALTLIHLASAFLKRPDVDRPTGERLSLILFVALCMGTFVGLWAPHHAGSPGLLVPRFVVLEMVAAAGLVLLPGMSTLSLEQRRTRASLLRLVLGGPRALLGGTLVSVPAMALLLWGLDGLLLAGVLWWAGGTGGAGWEYFFALRVVVLAFYLGSTSLVTALAYVLALWRAQGRSGISVMVAGALAAMLFFGWIYLEDRSWSLARADGDVDILSSVIFVSSPAAAVASIHLGHGPPGGRGVANLSRVAQAEIRWAFPGLTGWVQWFWFTGAWLGVAVLSLGALSAIRFLDCRQLDRIRAGGTAPRPAKGAP